MEGKDNEELIYIDNDVEESLADNLDEHKESEVDEEERKRLLRIEKFGKSEYEPDSYLKRLEQKKNYYKERDEKYERIRHNNAFRYTNNPDRIMPIKPKDEFKLDFTNSDPKLIKKRLMLYGVNLMNTNDICSYLGGRFIKKLYWLNDYTCVVEFDTETAALSIFNEFTNSESNKESDYNWKPAKEYELDKRMISIEMRVSEEGDLERKGEKKDAIYYKYYARNDKDNNGYPSYYMNYKPKIHNKRKEKKHYDEVNEVIEIKEDEEKAKINSKSRSRSRSYN